MNLSAKSKNKIIFKLQAEHDDLNEIISHFIKSNISIREIRVLDNNVEDIFFNTIDEGMQCDKTN